MTSKKMKPLYIIDEMIIRSDACREASTGQNDDTTISM